MNSEIIGVVFTTSQSVQLKVKVLKTFESSDIFTGKTDVTAYCILLSHFYVYNFFSLSLPDLLCSFVFYVFRVEFLMLTISTRTS